MRGSLLAKCGLAALGSVGLFVGGFQYLWWHMIGRRITEFSGDVDAYIAGQVRYIESLMEGQGEEKA